MAKSKSKSSGSSMIKDELKLLFFGLLEKESKNIIEWIKNISNIKNKIRKIVIMHGLFIAASVLILIGIAKYFESLIILPAGAVYIILGILVFLLMWVIKKV